MWVRVHGVYWADVAAYTASASTVQYIPESRFPGFTSGWQIGNWHTVTYFFVVTQSYAHFYILMQYTERTRNKLPICNHGSALQPTM